MADLFSGLEQQPKQVYFVTWVTHNSRISERMVELGIKSDKPSVWLEPTAEKKIAHILGEIIQEKAYRVLVYNICGDHVHMVLRCEESDLAEVIRNIKGKSSYLFHRQNKNHTPANKGLKPLVHGTNKQPLWAQKFNKTVLETDKMLQDAHHYVWHNRLKHNLKPDPELEAIIQQYTCSYDEFFDDEAMQKPGSLYTDGGSRGNPGPAAGGIVLYDEKNHEIERAGEYYGTATNNVAEYSALISGLQLAQKHNITELDVHMDSNLIVQQMQGNWKVKHPDMKQLCAQAQALALQFHTIRFRYIPRAQNKVADSIVNQVLDRQRH